MRLLTLEFFKTPARSNKMLALKDDRLFEWSAVQQICPTAPALLLMFETFKDETAQPLLIERPAMSREVVVRLDDEDIAVREEAPSGV